jgi:putative membrane-bound dehydrogenase-like protein
MLTGVAPNIFSSDIIPEQQAAIDRYTRELVDNLERVALAALSNRAPSKLSWSEGTVRFAKNRRVIRQGRAQFGENDTAPVDHTLATMFVHGADGKLRATLVNYACHCTTLGGEWNQIHADWSGYAQESIERDHPGSIALVSIGCGADANPSPRGKMEHAQAHGNEIAQEVRRLLAGPSKPLLELPDGKLKRFSLDFDPHPTRAQWEERAKKSGIVGYHAKKNLARLDRGEKLPTKLPYSVQTWTFGDQLAMVFLPGEVVIDYQRRLKREFDGTRLWVNGYANDVPCYIPSRRILTEGGYEAEDSLWYYDRPARLSMANEDRIIEAVHDLLPRKFRAKPARAGKALSASHQQALNSIRVAAEFTVDLVAAEPEVVDPVAIDWGADGKLWVIEMRDYPLGIDGNWKPGGTVKFLEDKDGDGRYERSTLFLDGLPFPTGVFAWRKGVLVCAAPDILYAEDTNNDGRADVVRKVFTGFETGNYQARVNSLSLGLDNWVYGANGLLGGAIRFVAGEATGLTGNNRPVASPATSSISIRGRDFRMNPDTGAFEPASGLTQQGRVRDDFGNWFGCDNSHLIFHYPLPDHYVRRNPHVAPPNASVHVPRGRDWNRLFPASQTLERFNDTNHANRVTSACGLEIYRDELLGKEFYGNAFTCEAVHNVVHREVLTPDGVTFRSTRAPNERDREFLASTDNWFRPAQVRTGPDGALWVVDMHREVIEHPRWIPSNRLAQLDVRAGADKGRIYRVYRKDTPPRAIKSVAKLSTSALAAALESPNGTERDMVHRELLNRGDASASKRLLQLAANSSRPAVRIQAMSALKGLNGLDQPWLASAYLKETHPAVQAHILSLGQWTGSDILAAAASHKDMRVRYQAALSAAPANHPETWLSTLCNEAVTNVWMRAAVLSGVKGATARQVLPAASRGAESAQNFALPDGLFATILGEEPIEQALSTVSPLAVSGTNLWALRSTRTVLELWKRKLASGWPDARDQVQAKRQEFDALCRQLSRVCQSALRNEAAPVSLRREGLKLLATVMSEQTDKDIMTASLRNNTLRDAAVDALISADSPDAPSFFTAHWREFSPAQRERILNGLASRAGWTEGLLSAIQDGTIKPAEVSATVRSRLLASQDAGQRERAEKLWPKRASNRAGVVAEYRKAITASGSVERGSTVFDNNCAACHVLGGRGTAVGPDIATFKDKSVEDILVAILDPNAALEPRYVNYIAERKNGSVSFGVIKSETATSLEMVAPGAHETLLKSDVAKIEALPLSLMPEGLEQSISPSEMNDLVAYLKGFNRMASATVPSAK